MAKLVLDDLGNFNQTGLNTLNHNSDKIEGALENTLSRDGTYPNQMEADLDMNHNDILNVDNVMADSVDATSLYLKGKQVVPQELVITGALLAGNNLSDVPDKESARTNLLIREPFATKTQAEAYSPAIPPNFIKTEGYSAVGDGGGVLYKKASSEPVHAGKLSITLSDGVTVVWYEIAESTVRPEMFGVEMDAGSDQSVPFQAMLDSGIKNVVIPDGTVRLDVDVTCDHDINIRGGVLDFSNSVSAQFIITGSMVQIDDLSDNVSKHSKTLKWSSDQNLTPGDIIILWNPTDYSWGGRRAVYHDGGMFRVHSTGGSNDINSYDPAVDAYAAADMNVYKMTPVRAILEDITAIPCSVSEKAPISLQYCSDSVIRDCRCLAGGTYGGIQVMRCYNTVYDCTTAMNNSPFVNNEYGIIITNSQHTKITGALSMATRHAVSVGGDGLEANIPSRYVTVSGMNLSNWAQGTGSDAAASDSHGNGDFVTYSDCVMWGFSGGGRNIKVVDSTIFGMDGMTSGMCVTMPEVCGGYVEFDNCEFITEGDLVDSSHACILIQPYGPGDGVNIPVETHMREKLYIRVTNCRVDSPNAGNNAKLLFVSSNNADKNIQVLMDGIEWNAPDRTTTGPLGFLYCRDQVLSAFPSDYLIVDNVYGPDGIYLIYSDADTASVPTREMQQSNRTTVTTTASTLIPALPVNFRYKYSRSPNAQIAISSTDGSASGKTAGQNAIPKIYELNNTSIRPAMLADSAFDADVSVDLHWTTEVRQI